MLKEIVVNRHYMTPAGVCHVVAYTNVVGVEVYEYQLYNDNSRHTILKEFAEEIWSSYDGDDFPYQENPKLPPVFDLLFDIKRESQLEPYHVYLMGKLKQAVQDLKGFNDLCKDHKLLGR